MRKKFHNLDSWDLEFGESDGSDEDEFWEGVVRHRGDEPEGEQTIELHEVNDYLLKRIKEQRG